MTGVVVVVGSFNVDHVWRCDALPAHGATLTGNYQSGPGGKGFNQAMAARRSGSDTLFICALGDDDAGVLARRLAATDDIELAAMDSASPTGTAGIFVDGAGRNSIVIGPGANSALSVAHVKTHRAALSAADVVLAQLESPTDSIRAALGIARQSGVRTVLNPAPANADTQTELLALADVITPNETEFSALIARHTAMTVAADAIATASDEALHMLCRALHPGGSVVITLGAMGSFVSHANDRWQGDAAAHYRVAAATAEAIDTTGAGDAFNGALCASWSRHPDAVFANHVRFAARYAARATEHAGAALAMPVMSVMSAG